jgi:hypothetical protein
VERLVALELDAGDAARLGRRGGIGQQLAGGHEMQPAAVAMLNMLAGVGRSQT